MCGRESAKFSGKWSPSDGDSDDMVRLKDHYAPHGFPINFVACNGLKHAPWGMKDEGNNAAVGDGWNKGQVMVNWHPGPRGHEVLASAFAYHYLTAMIDAVDKIAAALSDGGAAAALKAFPHPRGPPAGGRRAIPEPRFVQKGAFAGAALNNGAQAPVQCAMTYHPHVQGPSIVDVLDNSTSPCKWELRWALGQRDVVLHRYVDHKFALAGTQAMGWAHLALPGAVTGHAWVCDTAVEWGKYPEPRVKMVGNMEWQLNGKPHTPSAAKSDWRYVTRDKDRCVHFVVPGHTSAIPKAGPPETIRIAMRVKPSTKLRNPEMGEPIVFVSHVIWV